MNDFHEFRKPLICLVRHGETAAAKEGRLNGLTEEPLTDRGQQQAASLHESLATITWDRVLCSPLGRVRLTAQLAGFPNPDIVANLHEFDCGKYEGLTVKEVRTQRPDWDFWRDGCDGGETAMAVGVRVDSVLDRLAREEGATLVFSHAGTIRVLVARFLGLPGHMGSAFAFDPAHLGLIGKRSNYPAIILWNDGSHLPAACESEKDFYSLPH